MPCPPPLPRIVPLCIVLSSSSDAVLWFTGEAAEMEDGLYMPEEDEEEDDDDEDGATTVKRSGLFSASGGAAGGAAGAKPKAGGKGKEECKQQ